MVRNTSKGDIHAAQVNIVSRGCSSAVLINSPGLAFVKGIVRLTPKVEMDVWVRHT